MLRSRRPRLPLPPFPALSPTPVDCHTAVEATEEEALYAAVEEAQRMGAINGDACTKANQVAKEVAARQQ